MHESHPVGSPSSHRGKSTLMRGCAEFVTYSSFSGGLSELSPCCDFVGHGDRPILNFANKVHSLSSMRDSKASNLAPIRSTNAMT
ncbi:hypothetical protein B296_00021715 [Ensete ventricosum]|uniref:Uncharacterized protein n=1 Tax=Ensete ventricosum TaxID=4639 RepID=A0A427AY84_ENSVE|nr:hypothetical protein B296_00021715 [Ensete ventricosum]